jgi:type I restriction enzyme S subunit
VIEEGLDLQDIANKNNWKIVPMWTIATRKDRKGHPDAELLSVYREYGVIRKADRDDNHNVESDDLSSYKFVQVGDLVLNKMKTWQGSLGVSAYEGIVSPAYFVCELSSEIYGPYIHYLLRSAPYIAMYGALSKGIRVGQWDLPYEEFRNIPVLLPPLDEQKKIAEHLDSQLSIVNSLLEVKKIEFDQVGYYFDAVVRERILGKGTSSFDPPGWAGNLGVDRDLIPLGNLVRLRGEKNDPIKLTQILSLTAARGVILYEDKGAIGNVASEDVSRYSIVRKNDLVVNCMNIIIGSVGLSKYEGVLSPVYYVLIPISDEVIDMEYLALHFRIREFQRQLIKIGYGILDHRMRIPWINLKSERIVVPPLEIQREIVRDLSKLDKQRLESLSLIERSISLLHEYKTSIVSSLVTGLLDTPHKRGAA